MRYKSSFLKILDQRGFLHQLTDETKLDDYLYKNECVAYIGFDCTASSLHVGSLIQLMMLRWFQKCGHQPIVLLGGGTTKIGDPSGKDSARPILENKMIEKNKSDEIIKLAIKRMIPSGPLGRKQLSNCRIFRDSNHMHEAQNPKIIDISTLNKKNTI